MKYLRVLCFSVERGGGQVEVGQERNADSKQNRDKLQEPNPPCQLMQFHSLTSVVLSQLTWAENLVQHGKVWKESFSGL